jgi:hypothetical protein
LRRRNGITLFASGQDTEMNYSSLPYYPTHHNPAPVERAAERIQELPPRVANALLGLEQMGSGQYRTDRLLWAIFTAGVFVALGFVNPLAGVGKFGGDHDWWDQFGILVRGDYPDVIGDSLRVGTCGLVLAVPSAVLGWVLQALVVVSWSAARRATGGRDGNPRSEGRPEPGATADRPRCAE